MPGRRCFVLAASLLFALPLVRELVLWTRCIDARKAVGHSLLVVPGGEAEQELYLARIGFVKLAMQHGAALVPCYAFGTVDLYDVSPAQHAANAKGFLWTLSKRYGVALPRYSGSFGFVPKRRPMDLVFGDPLEPPCAALRRPAPPCAALRRPRPAHRRRGASGARRLRRGPQAALQRPQGCAGVRRLRARCCDERRS